MRAWFAKQLDELRGQLVVTAASVTSSIRWATQSLLHQDLDAAQQVSAAAAEMKATKAHVEELILQLLVRQQPVATDLRLALAGLHVVGDLERMSALADHIAKIVVLRHPVPVVPAEIRPAVQRMGEVAEELAWTVTRALETDDPDAAARMERDDDIVDTLHRDMFGVLFSEWTHGVQAAVDLTLICRYYERYADHAVNAGHQVVFMVTGEAPPS
ncbi:phosphate signaling complex protein PhoU [Dactylosporangium aurantiacum]|uniref:Phosphate-specific transport system accessory protein PhoU n=1 Tax=Dactylosporangium aurantiacum TaxID=35754 RepID=A0A9Q9IB09_9ACTN|nr:phosphate signaling complex protein PhoU [Dactylosporangium aurantiacum]MDG6108734.1 phosphate signaling complex protein PhoU [Dactylosporangium aurantiacum]UWZ51095.1 phosphate signaling complex protein PhoU [Dactylosporangium aurantiacum]